MRKAALLVAAGVLFLPSCGGSGNSGTSPTPVTTLGVQQASITLTQNGTAQVCNSPVKRYRIGIPVRFAKTAGLGFHVNFAEILLLNSNGTRVESAQIGADDITRVRGSNHFSANSSSDVNVLFDLNNTDFDGAVVTFDFTDGRGNRIQKTLNGISPVVSTVTCSF